MSKKNTNVLFLALGVAGVAAAANYARSSNLRTVRTAFSKWNSGQGSIFDLMADDAVIVIPGTVPHCGTFRKSVFVKEVATPFMARFSEPPVPRPSRIWSEGDDVAVLADAEGTIRDGGPYRNSYVFVLKMQGGHIVQATEFLDMVAFNDVWDRVEPASAADGRAEETR